jgi:hypothetical protein
MAESVDSNKETVEYMLTTVDNPWDPFTQFDQWLAFDMNAGYGTPQLLARITVTSDGLSDLDQFLAIQLAIDEIVQENVLGVHRKVRRGQVAMMNQ